MVAGFLWLNSFSKLQYDHVAAGISADLSCLTFLLPALLTTLRIGRLFEILERSFERVLYVIVAFCLGTSIAAATYGFRVVAIDDIYRNRAELQFPIALNYAIASTTAVLIPFAYACFALRRRYWMAADARHRDLILSEHVHQDRAVHAGLAAFHDVAFDIPRTDRNDPVPVFAGSRRRASHHHNRRADEALLRHRKCQNAQRSLGSNGCLQRVLRSARADPLLPDVAPEAVRKLRTETADFRRDEQHLPARFPQCFPLFATEGIASVGLWAAPSRRSSAG
ncbi:hypothetical protein ABIC03_002191 [Bradyrhizobium sp. RT6a]|uniref:hypothetical protein n=1 Tax=Bradyrhizobium sp. RT6a TaxID=3156381 RepID=UPI003393579C